MIMVYHEMIKHTNMKVILSIRGCVQWSVSRLVGWLVLQLCDNSNGLRDGLKENKAGYTATKVACGWAGAILEVIKTMPYWTT